MSWSGSQAVVLTAYHPSPSDVAEGPAGQARESAATSSPGSWRSGQYTMNHENSKKAPGKPPYNRSASQDSLDELSMDDYWKELENIHETRGSNHEEQEVAVVKEPDEGELEEEWLKEAGLSNLFGDSAGDSQESMVVLATLTRTQAAAVQKRVETVTQTMRKKNKQYQVPDVRDIFKQQSDSTEKINAESVVQKAAFRETIAFAECGAFSSNRTKEKLEKILKGSSSQSQPERTRTNEEETQEELKEAHPAHSLCTGDHSPRENMPVSETDINLEISFSEQASLKDNSVCKTFKRREDDTLLPSFRLPKDKTGTTKIGDLAVQDMKKIHSLALIELTALFDILGTELKPQKAIKTKMKESGLFGVPLPVLLEQDQKRVPGTRIPLIFQKLILQIEEGKLHTEGLLRIPGVATRIKSLCQDLEAKFYEGTFNWETVKQHDAASLLKLFIRELPQPLLTVEYLKAFQDVQRHQVKKHQLQALNLLILLLPEGNRDTLKALLEFLQRIIDHQDSNKMTLKNVAMVMAPNLFMFHSLGSKATEQSEFAMAAGTATVMRSMIKYQNLLWTIPTFLVNQVRKQNTESQKKEKKDKAMKKLLKKMAPDREKHEKQDKNVNDVKSSNDADVPQGVIRVQAPHLSKVSMAIQLTEELKAGEVVAKFLSQKSGTVQEVKKEEVFLYEIGGNIGERCLDTDTYMMDLYRLNPNAEWVIKSKNC